MTLAVVGPGGLGCLLAADLIRRQSGRVVLVDHNMDRMALLSTYGLNVEGLDGHLVQLPVDLAGQLPSDTRVVFLTVKATALEALLPTLAPQLPREATVVALQNGWTHQEILARHLDADRLIFAVTAMGATSLGWGHVRHAGSGPTRLGSLGTDQAPSRVRQVADLLTKAGWQAQAVADIREWLWRKLIVNCGINALGALLDVPNGRLLEWEPTRSLQADLVAEAVAVGQSLGFDLDLSQCLDQVQEVCRLTARNLNSMLQDIKKPAMTEVAFINGAVVSEGQRLGIPCPVNETVTRIIHAVEQKKHSGSLPGEQTLQAG